jgi:ABC-type glycerol-3-phosphate transport system permease component
MATTAVRPGAAQVNASARNQQLLSTIVRYVLLVLVGLILFAPFILAFFGTFKTNAEIIAFPPTILPQEWQFQNWPEFLSTDVGGTPQMIGATSLGLMTGLFAAFLTLLGTGLSSSLGGQNMSRATGMGISAVIAIIAGALAALFLSLSIEPGRATSTMLISIGLTVTIVMFIGVAILAMSSPDWRRVVMALGFSLVAGAVVTMLVTQIAVWAGGGTFQRWLFNTTLMAILRASIQVVFCTMAAYAFARLRFPGKEIIFSFMLASMMLPAAVTLVPAYVLIAKLEWVNTAYGLVVPNLVTAFGIFLVTQFFKGIPRELEEAAFVDGASYFQTFKDIIIPLARPVLLTLFILQFQGMWNDFLTPLLYLNTPDMWVLNVALSIFRQQYQESWNLTLVGAMINAIPVLILFFIFSRYYIEGVSYVGVKG